MNNYKIVSHPTASTIGIDLCHDANVELGVVAYESACRVAASYESIIDALNPRPPSLVAYLKFFSPGVVAALLIEHDRVPGLIARIDELETEVQALTLEVEKLRWYEVEDDE